MYLSHISDGVSHIAYMTVINLATQGITSLSLCLRFNGYALAIELVDRWYLRHPDM